METETLSRRPTVPPVYRGRSSSVLGIVAVYVLVFWILLPVFLLATGFRLDLLWPVVLPPGRVLVLISIGVLAVGVSLLVVAMGQLWWQGHGLPISHLPPGEIVTRGLYRYVRHPLYVGYTLAFAGTAGLLESFWMLAFSTPLLVLGWVAYACFFEEPALIKRFGEAYIAYRRRTGLLWPFPRRQWFGGDGSPVVRRFFESLNMLANHPVLFQRGPFILVTYGLFCAAGTLLCAATIGTLFVQQGLTYGQVVFFLVGGALATSTGAWLFWWTGHLQTLRHTPGWGLGQIGFVSYGGLAGIILFTLFFVHRYEHRPLVILDALMQGLFLIYAVGRVGCLTYGCCYGRPTGRPWGVIYKHPEAKMIRLGDHRHVARHPVQLYAGLHGLCMVFLLNMMAWASIPAGLITAAALMLAGLGRTYTESFRERPAPLFGRFGYGHLGAWIMFLAGWALLFFLSPAGPGHPQPPLLETFLEALPLLPAYGAAAFLVLVIYGVHWKRIGFWVG